MSRVEPYAIFGVCAYEATALATGRWPTITTLVRPLPRLVRLLLVGWSAWWGGRHFQVW